MREKVLHLVLQFKWFDLVASGKKRIEYRRDCEFWRKRLEGKKFVTLHRGYSKNTMTFKIERRKTVKGIIEIHLGHLVACCGNVKVLFPSMR